MKTKDTSEGRGSGATDDAHDFRFKSERYAFVLPDECGHLLGFSS